MTKHSTLLKNDYFCSIGKQLPKIVKIPKYDGKQGGCFGNDLAKQRFKLRYIKQCARKCDNLSACIGFVWNPYSKPSCFLKRAKCSTLRKKSKSNTYYKKGK